jgi:peptidoglycan-N-acetylglucosamine deacetylase
LLIPSAGVDRLCSISVDLDRTELYRAIHGLPERWLEPEPVLGVAIDRLLDWATSLGIPLTWFVVGRDLERQGVADSLLGLFRRGHELANHSLDHYYDLTRRGREVMREQVLGGSERLSRLTGKPQHGFRAPGYTMTDELCGILGEVGVAYDSSVFPCPAYYGAKAVALFGQRLFGRQSRAILDAPLVLSAPSRPYRVGTNYHRPGHGVLELPIQVTRRLRLPYLGTTLTMLGPIGAKLLTLGTIGEPMVNLELHGIDAIDQDDGLSDLARVQPDLRIPWRQKLETLRGVAASLKHAGYRFVTLEQAAQAIARVSG